MFRFKFITLILVALFSMALACNLPFRSRTPTPTPIPVSSEAVDELIENVQGAVETAVSTGNIQITFTEQQLTSLAVLELEEMGETRVQNLQIRLRNGLMIISGDAIQNNLRLPLTIEVRFVVDSQGKPHSEIVSAKAGILPVPDSMINELTIRLDQAIQEQINTYGDNVFIQSIVIENGVMTITGVIQ